MRGFRRGPLHRDSRRRGMEFDAADMDIRGGRGFSRHLGIARSGGLRARAGSRAAVSKSRAIAEATVPALSGGGVPAAGARNVQDGGRLG